jgi:hypothetical protein
MLSPSALPWRKAAETRPQGSGSRGRYRGRLRWLQNQKEADDKWHVIVDNADNVNRGIKNIITKGERGSLPFSILPAGGLPLKEYQPSRLTQLLLVNEQF